MNLLLSSIIIGIIFLLVFILIDHITVQNYGVHQGELSMETQCTVTFWSVFVVTFLLGVTSLDSILCSAH